MRKEVAVNVGIVLWSLHCVNIVLKGVYFLSNIDYQKSNLHARCAYPQTCAQRPMSVIHANIFYIQEF